MTQFPKESRNESLGAIVLCGGRSSRMGRPKHELPLGNETALQRVVRVVSHVATPVIIVGGEGIVLPPLPEDVCYVIDETPFPGPLAALAQGLLVLPGDVSAAFLVGCDMPLLSPAFLRQLQQRLTASDEIVAVEQEAFPQPFAAIYRRSVAETAESLLKTGTRSLQALLKACRTKLVPAEEFREVDPELGSLRNMNSEEDYRDLLCRLDRSGSPPA